MDKPQPKKSHLASDTMTVIIVLLTVLSIFLSCALLYRRRQIEA